MIRAGRPAQVRKEGLGDFQRPEGVSLERLSQVVSREGPDRQSLIGVDRGVIDQHIELVSKSRKLAGSGSDAVRAAHVHGEEGCSPTTRPDRVGNRSALVLVASSDHDVEAASCQLPGSLEPDTAVCTGDEDDALCLVGGHDQTFRGHRTIVPDHCLILHKQMPWSVRANRRDQPSVS